MKQLYFAAKLLLLLALVPLTAMAAPKKILLVTATEGFPHSSVVIAEKTLKSLGEKSKAFTIVDVVRSSPRPQDPAAQTNWLATMKSDLAEKMSPAALKNYDGIIFANTTGELPLPDRDAFIAWVKAGHAFIGTHSATDTLHQYAPYVEMIGGEFKTHGPQVKVECTNQDPKHPATKHFARTYEVLDEIYQFNNFHRDQVHGLLGLYANPNTKEPGDYPVAWCKQYGKGKVFYTSLGHREDVWESESYQQHILGGIKWALGVERGDAKPQSK